MKRTALLVGINGYGTQSGLVPLKYAESDAMVLAETLRGKCGFETKTLVGAQATRDAIEEALLTAGKGDTFLFFFAGHGQMLSGQYKLHPVDSTAAGLKALSFPELARHWQAEFGYEKVLAILDACRNEARGIRGGKVFDSVAARDIGTAIDGERWVEVLYGCREGQVSYEVDELEHGLLTAALLDVFSGTSGGIDSSTLAGATADWMRTWAAQDGEGRRQEVYRYHRPSLAQKIILVDGVCEGIKISLPQAQKPPKPSPKTSPPPRTPAAQAFYDALMFRLHVSEDEASRECIRLAEKLGANRIDGFVHVYETLRFRMNVEHREAFRESERLLESVGESRIDDFAEVYERLRFRMNVEHKNAMRESETLLDSVGRGQIDAFAETYDRLRYQLNMNHGEAFAESKRVLEWIGVAGLDQFCERYNDLRYRRNFTHKRAFEQAMKGDVGGSESPSGGQAVDLTAEYIRAKNELEEAGNAMTHSYGDEEFGMLQKRWEQKNKQLQDLAIRMNLYGTDDMSPRHLKKLRRELGLDEQ